MASLVVKLGDAFLIDTPPNKQHLYIAIAKTSENRYLFVNVKLNGFYFGSPI